MTSLLLPRCSALAVYAVNCVGSEERSRRDRLYVRVQYYMEHIADSAETDLYSICLCQPVDRVRRIEELSSLRHRNGRNRQPAAAVRP